MDVREYLRKPFEYEMKYNARIRHLKKLRAEISPIRGLVYDREKIMTSPSKTTETERRLIDIVDMENEIMAEAIELNNERRKIIRQIEGLPDKRYAQVLMLRYVEGDNLRVISEKVNYSYQWVRYAHINALQQFANLYNLEFINNNKQTSQ